MIYTIYNRPSEPDLLHIAVELPAPPDAEPRRYYYYYYYYYY